MKIKKKISIILCLTIQLILQTHIMAAEERPHKVLKKDGNIEIRQYDEIVTAKVLSDENRKKAANVAFRQLFKFISGENNQEEKIAMTTPVSQTKNKNDQWEVAFYMPRKMDIKTTPGTLNKNIEIKTLKQIKLACIKFSGKNSDKNLNKHQKILENYLINKKINYKKQAIYAFYDPPFMPWFMRRNEVCFEIIEKPN
eukprot:COSAG01_NODE_52_length_31456_cov_125.226648_21_plen_198_part_00